MKMSSLSPAHRRSANQIFPLPACMVAEVPDANGSPDIVAQNLHPARAVTRNPTHVHCHSTDGGPPFTSCDGPTACCEQTTRKGEENLRSDLLMSFGSHSPGGPGGSAEQSNGCDPGEPAHIHTTRPTPETTDPPPVLLRPGTPGGPGGPGGPRGQTQTSWTGRESRRRFGNRGKASYWSA